MLIKIDRSTIRKNPNVGRTEIFVPGRRTTSFVVRFAAPQSEMQKWADVFTWTINCEGCLVVSTSFDHGIVEIGATINPSKVDPKALVSRVRKMIDKERVLAVQEITVKTEQPVDRRRRIGSEPRFLFEHENTILSCEECNGQFNRKDLQSDCMSYGDDGEIFSDTICPLCGEWNCCELEFERLTPEMTAHLE